MSAHDVDDTRAQDEFAAILRRVRSLDPDADAEAVRRYSREIAEAEAVLNALDLDGVRLEAQFSPVWKPESEL